MPHSKAAAAAFTTCVAFAISLYCSRARSLHLRILALKRSLTPEDFARIASAYNVVHLAFQKYPPTQLALAFNGGKDCLIVFQLVRAYCLRYQVPMPFLVYFEREDEFPEMLEFMHRTVRESRQEIFSAKGGFKQGLQDLQSRGIKAVFMGQRRSDPFAPQDTFAPTTEGWPEMMRINPILDMTYASVWAFLIGTQTRYCSLYDQGYTSLGPKSKTLPHAKLSKDNIGRPAHELVMDREEDERSGRV